MLILIISSIMFSFLAYYIWYRIYPKKINYFRLKPIILFIILIIFVLLNTMYMNQYLKITTTILIFTLISYFLYETRIEDAFILSTVYEIGIVLSEIVFSIIISFFASDFNIEGFVSTFNGSLITNLLIFLIVVFLTEINFYRLIYNLILKLSIKLNKHKIILFFITVLISYNVIYIAVFSQTNLFLLVLINVIILCIYTYIVVCNLKIQNNYLTLSSKYDNTLDNLKEYEKMIDIYRISNHENKNQMLTIRNMIINKDKDVPKYIDKIVDNKLNDDDKLMYETSIIPEGGLRATIYSKLLLMKSKKIKYTLSINREVRNIDLTTLDDETVLNACKIIGVFLDNAIEENGDISIKLYVDKYLHISISNKFKGIIDIDNMYKEGYTTKENGHGYGLSLVKMILDNTPIFENKKEINDNIFTQILIIKK